MLAEEAVSQSLIQLQLQTSKSIKNAQGFNQGEIILDFVRQKFILSGGSSAWSLAPYPTPSEVSAAKPRIQVNSTLNPSSNSLVPRWEILQKQTIGTCRTLPSPTTSSSASLGPSDCPASAIEFVADSSALASVEKTPATGSEQRGFVNVVNPSKFTDEEKAKIFSDPTFSLSKTSAALQTVPISFIGYVSDPGNANGIRLRLAAGNVLGDIPIPTLPPSCTLTATRNANTATCTVTVTSSGVTTAASLTSNPSVTLNNSGNTWTNTSVSCSTSSSTTFTGSVTGPGSATPVACAAGVTIQAAPCAITVSRVNGSGNCSITASNFAQNPILQRDGTVLTVTWALTTEPNSYSTTAPCPTGLDSAFSVWSGLSGDTRVCKLGIRKWYRRIGDGTEDGFAHTAIPGKDLGLFDNDVKTWGPGAASVEGASRSYGQIAKENGFNHWKDASSVQQDGRWNYTSCGDNTHAAWLGSSWGSEPACNAYWAIYVTVYDPIYPNYTVP